MSPDKVKRSYPFILSSIIPYTKDRGNYNTQSLPDPAQYKRTLVSSSNERLLIAFRQRRYNTGENLNFEGALQDRSLVSQRLTSIRTKLIYVNVDDSLGNFKKSKTILNFDLVRYLADLKAAYPQASVIFLTIHVAPLFEAKNSQTFNLSV